MNQALCEQAGFAHKISILNPAPCPDLMSGRGSAEKGDPVAEL